MSAAITPTSAVTPTPSVRGLAKYDAKPANEELADAKPAPVVPVPAAAAEPAPPRPPATDRLARGLGRGVGRLAARVAALPTETREAYREGRDTDNPLGHEPPQTQG